MAPTQWNIETFRESLRYGKMYRIKRWRRGAPGQYRVLVVRVKSSKDKFFEIGKKQYYWVEHSSAPKEGDFIFVDTKGEPALVSFGRKDGEDENNTPRIEKRTGGCPSESETGTVEHGTDGPTRSSDSCTAKIA